MTRDASIGVNLIGRDVSASKALNDAGRAADKLGKKVLGASDRMVKGIGVAAAAAGALAIKLGVDSVKAAMEDQKSVALLVKQIHNSTEATVAQTKAVQDYVDAQELRLGVDDTVIRAGLTPLLRATGDTTKAQKLMTTALNLSAMTGKDSSQTALALAKAYNGNFGAVTRLGISIDKATLKSKDFSKVLKIVDDASRGFAAKGASTTEGKMRRVAVAFDRAKESMGYMLMETLTPYMRKLTDLIPKIEEWVQANGPKMRAALEEALPKVQAFVDKLGDIARWVSDNKDTVFNIGRLILGGLVAAQVYQGVASLVGTLNLIRTAYLGIAAAQTAAGLGTAAAGAGAAAGAIGTAAVALPAAAFAGAAAIGLTRRSSSAGVNAGTDKTQPVANLWGAAPQTASGPANMGGGAPIVIQNVYGYEDFVRKVDQAQATLAARRGR